nr:Gag-Pol polyprotein [Tanacetum cinerariifolium]
MQTQTSNALHNAIVEAGGKDHPSIFAPEDLDPYEYKWTEKAILVVEGISETTTERYMENYKNVSQDIHDLINAEAEAVQIILTRIHNDIYSTVDACPNACEMWKAIERLKQGESINIQELKIVSYHKHYDILKQHHNKFNKIRAERVAHTANPLALVAQQQPVYHPQNHPTHYTQNSSTKLQQLTRSRGKAIVNTSAPIYDQEPATITKDDEMLKENEINKVMALISLSGIGYDNQRLVNVVGARKTVEQGDTNITIDSLNMCYDREQDDQNDVDELAQERDLLASLIEKLKCEIDDNKNRNKLLETSNKTLVDKLKCEIKDFKTKDKSLESSNNHFKEANNELSKTNQLMFKDLKKFQAELDMYHDVNYASKVAIDCQSVQTLNILNRNCKMSFAKPEFLKKAQRANPRLYDIGRYNDNLALMLAPESDESQELKTVSYHKLYDILKQHHNEVNEIRIERIARFANPLVLVAQQQPIYNPHNHPTHYTQNYSTRSQHAATRNRGKAIVNSSQPIYDQEPSMVAEDDKTSKDKEIDKLMALIFLSFKKIYKPTNNNLRTPSNTSRENQDNSLRINKSTGYENQRIGNVAGARETVGLTVVQKSGIQCYNCKEFGHVVRECQKPKRVKDAAYHRKKMLLYKQEEARIQLNAERADWRDDTDDDELEDQELEAHYMYMAQLQEVSPDAADSGPIFDDEPLQKVSNDDHYNAFAIRNAHPEQSKSVHDTYPIEQDAHTVIIDSL